MAVNSVSSDFRRTYSSAQGLPSGAVSVRTAGPVPKVNPVSGHMPTRDERELAAQQQALIGAVKDLLSPQAASGGPGANRPAPDGAREEVSAGEDRSAVRDPVLEQAILKFMHALFQSLKDVDSVGESAQGQAGTDASGKALGMRKDRSELGARLAELAQALSGQGAGSGAGASFDTPGASALAQDVMDASVQSVSPGPGVESAESTQTQSPADSRLAETYSDLMQVLREDAFRGDLAASQLAELSALVQRLAQAMKSASALGNSIPTLGALLSTRA